MGELQVEQDWVRVYNKFQKEGQTDLLHVFLSDSGMKKKEN